MENETVKVFMLMGFYFLIFLVWGYWQACLDCKVDKEIERKQKERKEKYGK